ncbi:MAG: hypothetical protein AAF633_18045, partial [Chloroflexota bacterium]
MNRNSYIVLLGLCTLLVALVACGSPQAAPEEAAVEGGEGAAVQQEQQVVVEEPTAVSTQPPPSQPTAEPTLPAPVVEETAAEAVVEEAAPAKSCQSPYPTEFFGYGIQSHAITAAGDPAPAMNDIANKLGMEWVKVQFEWWLVQPGVEDRQWFFYDGAVEQANKQGLCLMFSIVGAPEYLRARGNHIGPPDDYNQIAPFLTELLTRYPGQIHAIEVWNEMNLDREWQTDNGVNPEDYVRFLQIAHDAIKEADPNVIVISGALAPTGGGDGISWLDDFIWLDRAIAAG